MSKIIPSRDFIINEIFKQLDGINPEVITPYVFEKDDSLKENLTLNYFPDLTELKPVLSKIAEIKELDPQQLFLDRRKLHITLIGEIDPTTNVNSLILFFKKLLSNYSIGFRVLGTASNKSTGSFITYPSFDLHDFREKTRQGLGISGTDYTIHLSIYEFVGWINYVRYLDKPSQEFLHKIKIERSTDFGDITKGKILLLRNRSRTLADGKFEVLHEF